MRIRALILIAIPLLLITACGGGGGGRKTPAPTKATLKLATSGTGTTIYGIDVTVNLAPGVTVKSSLVTHQTDTGVVVPSGGAAASGTFVLAVYSAATGTIPGKVHIVIENQDGFTTGEFCTVNTDIAAGYAPKSSDFNLENFSASDALGRGIEGLTPGLTADIQ